MNAEKQKKYDGFRSFTTYIDVLSYALALSEVENFHSDPDKWHEAVYDICQKYREEIPELKRIYFTRREPLPPQSVQVDRLIKILGISHEISMPNPTYPTIDMSKEKKVPIMKREKERLSKYPLNILKDISNILEKKTRVKV